MATSGWQRLIGDEKDPGGTGIYRLSAAPAQRLPATDLHVGVGSVRDECGRLDSEGGPEQRNVHSQACLWAGGHGNPPLCTVQKLAARIGVPDEANQFAAVRAFCRWYE